MTVKIGNTQLPNPYILAPMAGVTDLPFRVLCAEKGAGMVCTEMISAKALSYKNKATFHMLRTSPEEGIVSLQIFGSEPELMGEIAGVLEEYPFQILDINMGCPVPKVAGNGEGSALMKNPELAGRIMKCVSRGTKKPVTAKIRTGYDEEHINAVEVAKILEENGAAAIAVHGRTREQFYHGEVNLEIIAKVKEAVSVPVIGNGDVKDYESAKHMMEYTGCDAVMIGRAARGNPWIFEDLLLEKPAGGARREWSEVREMILRHAEMLVGEKGEYTAIREMRQHIAWYSAGYHGSSNLRRRINEATDMETLKKILTRE